ncbi:LysR substrate-binding domain-containing protein [Mesorhizobium shangrilense]|uniref:LysR substrate-binding domain-containing protein n=1 Tax=Mesorhizobium shangrilense TaxID=460060 RepID=A0ABV2DBK4_9HYPH
MARRLPPFAALRAFEAAARAGSLADAAEELLISSSAVSHQIKSLETFVSAKLFLREQTGLKLTEIGEKYLEGLGDALDRIEASTLSVMQDTKNGGLTIHLFQSLAQMWLIPQLDDFLSSNPEISVKLITKPDDIEFSGSSIDIDIRYAMTAPAEHMCEKLIDEVIAPVVSPDYLRHNGPIETPEDLLGRRLIGCEYVPHEWDFWFEKMGVQGANQTPKLMFDSRSHALLAASEGMGVAMNRRPYGDTLLKRGSLIAPFTDEVPTGGAYYFIAPKRSAGLARVKHFKAWLLSLSTGLRSD